MDENLSVYNAKINALEIFCKEKNYEFKVFFDKDLKEYHKQAKQYHETQKENNNSL